MKLFFEYLIVMIIATIGLTQFVHWIRKNHPKSIVIISVILSFLSAYAASFLFDMIVQVLIEKLSFRNVILPLFSWVGISMVFYNLSKEVATNKKQIAIPFYILGSIIILMSFIGKFYNIYVGLFVLTIGASSNFIKNDTK